MGWSLILFDFDLLDHLLCCHPLTSPIFQCENGHIACSSCCITLMRNKCTSCTLSIGIYGCRILEKLVEAVILPCPNAKHGCPEKFSYGKELVHRDDCGISSWSIGYSSMTRILRLSFEAPVLNYMFIPYSVLDERLVVKMEIRIREIGYEEEEIDKKEPEEEKDDDNENEDAEE
ncbi:hypothetical protein CARUB_v10022008mg [Capsella rubella]|uniref:E3 ubiquitin-protein ligase Sina-like RING finger domain-containing protein n=1 Tax=Capsella rubella TaxID=81985 RepID=R0ICU0_9BRAS|nr:hypothetical protein CARUB_v10022008mg [Capsella rubella]